MYHNMRPSFVRKVKNTAEPSTNQYQIIAGAMAGRRVYILDDRVTNWRGKNITSLSGYTWYGQFPAGTGNNFFIHN